MNNKEVWKDVKNHEGIYKVSNFGRVKSLKFGKDRILKAGVSTGGYYIVLLRNNGKTKTRTVHQLVAESFLGHVRCGLSLVVNHINFDKTDNRIENLEIVTQRENCNKKHLKSTSKYIGVHWNKYRNKWHAQIIINGNNKYLGRFDNETEASNAYQTALKQL